MTNRAKQELTFRPIRNFPWLLVGSEELLLFGGFILISWLASSASLYVLEASLFLVVVSLLQILLVILIWQKKGALQVRLFASFHLLPSWHGIIALVTITRLVITLSALVIIIWASQLKIILFPSYWWDVGYRFLLVSVDLSVLFPLALKTITTRNKEAPNIQKFLISWAILILGWLGGFIDFEGHIFPPKVIVISSGIALLIALLILYAHKSNH